LQDNSDVLKRLRMFNMFKYVGPPYLRAEMYAGRVARCLLLSMRRARIISYLLLIVCLYLRLPTWRNKRVH